MSEFPQPQVDPAVPTASGGSFGRWSLITLALIVAAAAAWWGISREGGPVSGDPLTVSWLVDSTQVLEDVGVVELTAVLSAPAPEDLVITIETRGTASVTGDFDLLTSSLGIAAGESQAVLPILVIDDGPSGEGRETAKIAITGVTTGRVGARDTFTLVIEDPRTGTATRSPTTTTTTSTTAPTTTTTEPARSADGEVGVTQLGIGSTQSASSVTVEPFESEPDTVVLLLVASATSKAPTATPVPSGDGLEWELVDTSTRNGGPRRISMFRAASGPGGSHELVMDFGDTQEVINWMVIQVENVPTAGNGAAAILQTGVSAAVAFEFNAAVELGPLQTENSITIGGFFIGSNRAEGVPGFETIGTVGPTKRLLLGIVGEDSSVRTADWPTRAHWIGVAVEITTNP